MTKNLLLFSSSRVKDSSYLEHVLPYVQTFLENGSNKKNGLLFVPYAGVSISFDQYESKVQSAFEKINIKIRSIHQFKNKLSALNACSGIIVGGGNTFSLLYALYREQLLKPMNNMVSHGVPYIGWSAGSNIVAPNIRTTNDMPIVEPPSLASLNLIPWQINPHYIDDNYPEHNGETRQQRLEEFLLCNPNQTVIALPEGASIKLQGEQISYLGDYEGYIFTKDSKVSFKSSTELRFLLSKNATAK